MRFAFLLAALLAGCAGQRFPDLPPPSAPVEDRAERAAAPASGNVAVLSLVQNARTDSAAGRLANAGANLERALRIEPRNPRLWQELARVRMAQGDYAQAESVAARSNSWAGNDDALRIENWRLIAQAREARGDAAGARAAQDIASKFGR